MDIPDNMRPVAYDGEMLLYADEDDEYGVLVNTHRQSVSPVKPLQVFFKWGNFYGIEEGPEE